MIHFVDLRKQYLSIKEDIDTAINNVISESAFIGGKYVNNFEIMFADLIGAKHCIPCANGTDAIYILLKMMGVGAGDEVITTASSWISTSETISQTGARPVFIDVDQYSTINPELIENKITSKTKGIIVVHLYGQAVEVDKIKELKNKYNLFMIEDCAQAHLTQYKGQYTGTFGDAATFSFYPGKNLGAYGDAGCIVSNNDDLAMKCRMYANHGAKKKHFHIMEGINSRLDGLQAAILCAKLPHLKSWTEKRIERASYYSEKLRGLGDLELPEIRPQTRHSFHLYVIKTRKRNELMRFLEKSDIQTAIHYPSALPMLEAYKYLNHTPDEFPVAVANHDSILSLPIYPELSFDEIDYIVKSIKNFYNSNDSGISN